MKKRVAWFLLFLCLTWVCPVSAEDASSILSVTESGISAVVEVVYEVPLEYDETYESPYIDVRDYRHATFYVIPSKALNEKKKDVRFKLDAFFSVDAQLTQVRGFGGKKIETESGYQEFGAFLSGGDGQPGDDDFTHLTTGETSYRMLHVPIYGPFVRLVLKSLTKDERRGYRIVGYLSR